MAERYEKKYTLAHRLYADGAPVLIAAGALLDDSLSRRRLVQLKFKSVSEKKIASVRVSVTALNAAGEARGAAVEYLYAGLNAPRDAEFGQKSAIVMPESDAASFTVSVTEVTYTDGSRWDGTGAAWTALHIPRTLADALGGEEVAGQFAIRYGIDCVMMPEDERGLWVCACGAINRETEAKCHRCRRVYAALKNINLSSLRTESAQRVETEKQQDVEEKEEKKSAQKKLIIALAVLIPVIMIAAAALCTVPRYIRQQQDYAAAVALLDAGKYDEAESAFAALGSYGDAEEYAERTVPYKRALYIMDCAKNDDVAGLLELGLKRSDVAEGETVSVALYREADKLFAALGDYADCAAQRESAQRAIEAYFDEQKRGAYDAAQTLLEEGCYLKARDAFLALGGYKDSADMAKESMYRRASALCEVTEKYFMQGVMAALSDTDGEKSVFYIPQSVFAELGNGVSSDIRSIFRADGAEINIADAPESGVEPICQTVSAQFAALGDYKDSAAQMQRALDAGDFTRPFYQKCAEGDIIGAYQWLAEYKGEFDNREQWLNVLQFYAPYCGTWELYKGDPTLIAQTSGLSLKCGGFTSKVIIDDTSARLIIYPAGGEDYPIELTAVVGSNTFTVSPDGVTTYCALISNLGRFTYTKYNSLVTNQSCEYAKVG